MSAAGSIAVAQLLSSQNYESEGQVDVAGIVCNRSRDGAQIFLEHVGIEDRRVAQRQVEQDDDGLGGAGAEVFCIKGPGMCSYFSVDVVQGVVCVWVSACKLARVVVRGKTHALSAKRRCKSDAQPGE
jgi:hypothetical protein